MKLFLRRLSACSKPLISDYLRSTPLLVSLRLLLVHKSRALFLQRSSHSLRYLRCHHSRVIRVPPLTLALWAPRKVRLIIAGTPLTLASLVLGGQPAKVSGGRPKFTKGWPCRGYSRPGTGAALLFCNLLTRAYLCPWSNPRGCHAGAPYIALA